MSSLCFCVIACATCIIWCHRQMIAREELEHELANVCMNASHSRPFWLKGHRGGSSSRLRWRLDRSRAVCLKTLVYNPITFSHIPIYLWFCSSCKDCCPAAASPPTGSATPGTLSLKTPVPSERNTNRSETYLVDTLGIHRSTFAKKQWRPQQRELQYQRTVSVRRGREECSVKHSQKKQQVRGTMLPLAQVQLTLL